MNKTNLIGKRVTYTNRRGHELKAKVLEQPSPDSVTLLIEGWPVHVIVSKEFVKLED